VFFENFFPRAKLQNLFLMQNFLTKKTFKFQILFKFAKLIFLKKSGKMRGEFF